MVGHEVRAGIHDTQQEKKGRPEVLESRGEKTVVSRARGVVRVLDEVEVPSKKGKERRTKGVQGQEGLQKGAKSKIPGRTRRAVEVDKLIGETTRGGVSREVAADKDPATADRRKREGGADKEGESEGSVND